jgi:flavoprotein
MVFKYSKKFKKNMTFKDIVLSVEGKGVDKEYRLWNDIYISMNGLYNGWVVYKHYESPIAGDVTLMGGEDISLVKAKAFALKYIKSHMRTK